MHGIYGRLTSHFKRNVRAYVIGTSGTVATMTAILSPVLIGGMGLGSEAGYWYYAQRELQNAVDVAAHATAIRSNNGDDQSALQSVADLVVGNAGVDLDSSAVAVNRPPLSGAYIEDGAAVEISVTRTVPRLFSAIFNEDPITISARAVATAQSGGRGCVIALSDTEQGAITVTGSTNINLIQCDFVSNASGVSFDMSGASSNVLANCIQTSGTATTTSNLTTTCETLRQNAAPVSDPFAAVAEPSGVGACQSGSVGTSGGSTSVTPVESHPSGMTSIRYCNGLTLSGNVALGPGLYIIEGSNFQIDANAMITGTGVVFYLADGVELVFNGSAGFNVSAPTSGTYNGMLVFASRSSTTAIHRINGNMATMLSGAIYTPESHIDFQGSATTSYTGCGQVIADTIEFTSNPTIMIHCLFPSGATADIAGSVAVVE
ncbi:MAG: pilus assembly protein TadG-related protein, partial [Pseudomonadota bacterium]